MLNISQTEDTLRVEIKVQPRSSRNQFAGEVGGALKIKLTAPPVDGEANQALIEFLAGTLKIPKNKIRLVRGDTSRNKLVEIQGITMEKFQKGIGL